MKKYLFVFAVAIIGLLSCATQQERAERKELMRKTVTEAVATAVLLSSAFTRTVLAAIPAIIVVIIKAPAMVQSKC